MPLMYKLGVDRGSDGYEVASTAALPPTVTGLAIAVTPVCAVLALIAAAVAIPLACGELLAASVLLTVSSEAKAALILMPLIDRSFA